MSKTLHHGLEILELLTSYPHGLSVTDIADGVGVHRTVAHRLIRTLEAHHLCRKDSFKRVTLGAGLVTLAEPVEQDLRTLARPILQELAEATEATAHLVVRESDTEVRALMVVEPRSAKVHVAFSSRAGRSDRPRLRRAFHPCLTPADERGTRGSDGGTRTRLRSDRPARSSRPSWESRR